MANETFMWQTAQIIAVDYSAIKPAEISIKFAAVRPRFLPRLFQVAAHWENYSPHALFKNAVTALSQSRKNFINTKSVSNLRLQK
jgi:hypothetical protein